jgi:serine/threonine protein kinase
MIKPGTLLQNRYRVAEQIGKGGMGEVYVATDERFQSTVALKRTFYDDPQMLRAFEREARLLNRLRHAALPKVSDHFGEGGGQFLVMEFIEGSDLSELLRLRKVPFPLADVLRWADELLDALEYLHAQEPPVVHRDIKPPNIKLTPQGRVVLLDFGLAKGSSAQTASGTASSVFGFSLSFAPLEQMQGAGTDTRSDLYSLAATLYFLLTCVRPPDALTRAAAAVKGQPDPLRPAHLVQPQVPEAVGRILHRAMSQDPELRHASAAELRADLRGAANAARQESRQEEMAANPSSRISPDPRASTRQEPRPQPRASSQRAADERPRATDERPRSSTPSDVFQNSTREGESVTKASARRRHYVLDSRTATARAGARSYETRSRRTKAFVACALVACALAFGYLFTRRASPHAPPALTNSEPENPTSLHQQAVQSQAKPSTFSGAAASAFDSDAPTRPSPRAVGGTNASDSKDKTDSTAASGTARPDNATGGTTSAGVRWDGDSTAGGHTLVIRNPAPAVNPADEARRAEESQPRRPQYQPADRPPPPCPGCPPPPPPPGGRLPPPDGRRPPPR